MLNIHYRLNCWICSRGFDQPTTDRWSIFLFVLHTYRAVKNNSDIQFTFVHDETWDLRREKWDMNHEPVIGIYLFHAIWPILNYIRFAHPKFQSIYIKMMKWRKDDAECREEKMKSIDIDEKLTTLNIIEIFITNVFFMNVRYESIRADIIIHRYESGKQKKWNFNRIYCRKFCQHVSLEWLFFGFILEQKKYRKTDATLSLTVLRMWKY